MRIGIGVPTRNRPYYLMILLSALLRQDYEDWDLVIVNDWDAEDTLLQDPKISKLLEMAEQSGHCVKILRGLRQGPHFAHNLALRELSHELILRIDDDLFPQPDFLRLLYEPFVEDKRKKLGAVAGVYPPVDYSPDWVAIAERYRRNLSIGQSYLQLCCHKENRWCPVESLYSSFLYRREVLEKIGGFPECYSEAGHTEETDTTLRIKQAGYELLVVTGALAWHFNAEVGGLRDILGLDELRKKDVKLFTSRFGIVLQKW